MVIINIAAGEGLNQKHEYVPTGISMDIPTGLERSSYASRSALLAQKSARDLLLQRYANGEELSLTESVIIERIFATDQAHGL